jgi:hypothetical protein
VIPHIDNGRPGVAVVPSAVDIGVEPKDFAVVAKRVQVAGVSGDLNNFPGHVFSYRGAFEDPLPSGLCE